MNKFPLALCLALGLSACSNQMEHEPLANAKIQSLAGQYQVSDIPAADPMPEYPKKGERIARDFAEQPPLVPHQDYAITLEKNSCLSCHDASKTRTIGTKVPMSHTHADKQLKGQNYFCTQCHVPQASNTIVPVETVR